MDNTPARGGGNRRQSRRLAVQLLYAQEMNPEGNHLDPEAILMAAPKVPEAVLEYTKEILAGLNYHQGDLDLKLVEVLEKWEMERVNVVERCILRLALYEITFCPQVPATVALNEAIELARVMGDDEAWRFVNGVLEPLAKKRLEMEEKARTAHPRKNNDSPEEG